MHIILKLTCSHQVDIFIKYFSNILFEFEQLILFVEAKSASDPLLSFAEISKPVTNGILELTSKLMESTIVPAIPFHKINPSNIIQSVG